MVPSETKNLLFCKRPSLRGSKGEEHYVPSETHSFEVMQKVHMVPSETHSSGMSFIDFLVFNRKGNSPLILTEMLFQVRLGLRNVTTSNEILTILHFQGAQEGALGA